MNFYIMNIDISIENYAMPGPEINFLEYPCDKSEFQFLEKTPLSVELSLEGGTDFADFILYKGVVPLVSDKLRQAFIKLQLDNLYYKPIYLVSAILGINEPYWLALPPRINCLDWENCEIEEDDEPDCDFWAQLHEVTKIVISPPQIGHYKIFKLPPNLVNREIIITEEVKDALERQSFENLNFYPLNTEIR